MIISLKNKNALVGGSTQGIGKAIAVELAKCGANVTLLARNEKKLISAVLELNSEQGQKHSYIVSDFYDLENHQKIITNFFTENSVDILVNNTNGPETGNIFEKNAVDYQKAFNLLFQTVCHTTLEALKNMKKNGFGRIINVSSNTVKEPVPHLSLSNTIRAAVVSWSKTLATEVAKDNITVNNILTGYFDTERLNSIMIIQAKAKNIELSEYKKQKKELVPMKRFGKPEEYGYLVSFLASEYAAYITGTNIPIDGGLLRSV